MASITEVAIKRPLLITVMFVTLILFGFVSYKSLNYNLLPTFDIPVVLVQTIYPGASSDEVESSITKNIEDAVSSIEGVKTISSSSRESISIVTIELNQGIDANKAQLDAERKISQILKLLPEEVDEPVVSRFSLDDMPIMSLSVTSNMSSADMYDFVDLKLKPILTNVPGVAQVNIIGGNEREIEVKMDNDKLYAYGISVGQVQSLIARAGMSFPAGNIQSEAARYSLRLDAKLRNVDEIRSLIIRENADGSKILLKDVATVTDSQMESTTLNRINGRPGIGIQILKQTDANTVSVAQLAREKIEAIKQANTKMNFNYEVASDQSIYTMASADAVMHDLYLAVIIVALVMIFFLHSVRSSMFVLVAIPSAMIPTFILMYAFGFSLNLMTLMALSLVVGILVDDSIVVLENIYRHMEMGKHKRIAALEGRNEIGFTAISITLVDVVVFLPLALAGGLIGNILREFSLVIVFSTLMSLVVAFTLTPLLASRWGKLEHLNPKTLWGRLNLGFESIIDGVREFYLSALKWCLNHKLILFIGIIALFISTVIMLPAKGFVGASFMQAADKGELSIQIDMSPEYTLEQTNQVVADVEKKLLRFPEVKKVFSNVGTQTGEASSNASANSNLAEIMVVLNDKNERSFSTDEFGRMIRDSIISTPGISVIISPVGLMGTDVAIQMAVKGTDPDSVKVAGDILRDIVKSVPGTDFVRFSTKSAKKDISIDIDREKLSMYGLSIAEVGSAVQLSFQGNDDTKYKEKGEEYNINIMLDKADKYSIDEVRNLTIQNSQGKLIRLMDFADVVEVEGQSIRERMDRMTSIQVKAAKVGRPTGTIIDEIKAKIAETKWPEGTEIKYLGAAANQEESFASLGLAIILGILLMYFIMVALYESVIYPFVVLFSIPVSFIGAFLALAITMNELSIFAILGLIMLLGLVAKNAILIVDFTNHEKEKGLPVREALMAAGSERLRPILMTTLAMVFGMLPIAMASGDGAEVKNGMAWVIIGGLTSSMLLTLVLVPSVYLLVDTLKDKIANWKKKKSGDSKELLDA